MNDILFKSEASFDSGGDGKLTIHKKSQFATNSQK